ncbi:hypothetical protein MRB53_030112 [Persea americana]|uniref:Uncharacterized protein n=1 Tax=Persea americana TaxID=3435 RepID=A0ACC2KKX4_PERAE|nr:hypothetical protein MRB53_030112 [Persea americana]
MELTRCGTRGVNARTSSWDVFGATMRETNHETYDEEELVTNEAASSAALQGPGSETCGAYKLLAREPLQIPNIQGEKIKRGEDFGGLGRGIR